MQYDLIIIGETELAHREAVRAARDNHLVAVVRPVPLMDAVLHFPLQTWNWTGYPTWKTLKAQFESAELKYTADYVHYGIELFQGRPANIESGHLTLVTRNGETIDLFADSFECYEQGESVIPDWLKMEVPHVITLDRVPRLDMLPESVFIEGNSLAALRFAVLCARLNRNVILCSAGWNSPELGAELTELEDEALQRGILRIDQQDLHSVCESSSSEFDIWLLNGDVHRTGLYVYATERACERIEQLAGSN